MQKRFVILSLLNEYDDYQSLQSGWLWAISVASFRGDYWISSCWIVFKHFLQGRPHGVRSSGGKAVTIWLASASSFVQCAKQRCSDWTMSETDGVPRLSISRHRSAHAATIW